MVNVRILVDLRSFPSARIDISFCKSLPTATFATSVASHSSRASMAKTISRGSCKVSNMSKLDIVSALLANGADRTVKDARRVTALNKAGRANRTAMMERLRRQGEGARGG